MRWRTADKRYHDRIAEWDSLGQWHAWFAWHPVKIDWQWVWLTTVERRLRFGHRYLQSDGRYQFTNSTGNRYDEFCTYRIEYQERT